MAVEIASLYAKIGADTSGLKAGLKETDGLLGGLSGKFTSLGASLAKAGGVMTAATLPLAIVLKNSIKLVGDFETQINILGVAARDSGVAMDTLRNAALQVGADTELVGITAAESADAMTYFYKQGLTTSEIFGDLNGYLEGNVGLQGALRAAIDLSAASSMDLARASDIVAVAMATFGINASGAAGVADVLVKAADASVTSVDELGDAFINVGTVAASAGMSLDDTSVALAVLSQTGSRGAEAGTRLKSMLMRIIAPTDKAKEMLQDLGVAFFDLDGNMKPLPKIIDDFTKATKDLTNEKRLEIMKEVFGSYGIVAAEGLMKEGIAGWNEMVAAIDGAAGVTENAEARTRGWQGAMEQLGGAWETFQIKALTPILQNTLTPLVKKFTDFINTLSELSPGMLDLIAKFALAAVVAGPVLMVLGGIATAIGAILSPIGLVIVAIAALGAAFVVANGGIGPTIEKLKAIWQEIQERVQPALARLRTFWETLWPRLQTIIENLWNHWQTIWMNIQRFIFPILETIWAKAQEMFGKMLSFIIDVVTKIRNWIDNNFGLIQSTITRVLEKIKEIWDAVWPYLNTVIDLAWTNIKLVVGTAIDAVLGIIKAVMLAINGDWEGAWEEVKRVAGEIWETIKTVIGNTLTAIWEAIGPWVTKTWNKFKTWTEDLGRTIKTFFTELPGKVKDWLLGIVTKIEEWARDVVGKFEEAGRNIIEGIKRGISEKASQVVDAIGGLAEQAWDRIKSFFGIHSPSTLMMNAGEMIAKGLADGIKNGTAGVVAAMNGLIMATYAPFGEGGGPAVIPGLGHGGLGTDAGPAIIPGLGHGGLGTDAGPAIIPGRGHDSGGAPIIGGTARGLKGQEDWLSRMKKGLLDKEWAAFKQQFAAVNGNLAGVWAAWKEMMNSPLIRGAAEIVNGISSGGTWKLGGLMSGGAWKMAPDGWNTSSGPAVIPGRGHSNMGEGGGPAIIPGRGHGPSGLGTGGGPGVFGGGNNDGVIRIHLMRDETLMEEVTLRIADILGVQRDIYISGALAGGVR